MGNLMGSFKPPSAPQPQERFIHFRSPDDSENTSKPSDADFLRSIFSKIEEIKESGKYCDVTIRVGDRSFVAHRLILAAGIPYFKAMFTKNFSETRKEEITLDDLDPVSLQCLINFLYTGKIRIKKSSIHTLLSTAVYLQFDRAIDVCYQYLLRDLNVETVLDILDEAKKYQHQSTIEKCFKYVGENFEDVSMSESFMNLPFSRVRELIKRDDIFVVTEEVIFESVIRWVKSKVAEKIVYLPGLLHCVRIPLLSSEYLDTKVLNDDLLVCSNASNDILNEIKNWRAMPGVFTETERFCESKDHLKHAKVKGCTIYSMYASRARFMLNYYDSVHEKWVHLANLQEINKTHKLRKSHHIICLEDKMIFVMKGQICTLCLKTFKCTCVKWGNENALWSTFCVHRGTIYFTEDTHTASGAVYALLPEHATIYKSGSTTVRRFASSFVSLGEYIYITGGHSVDHNVDVQYLRDAERYDPLTGHSTQIAPIIQERAFHSSVALDGKILLCGGRNDESHMMTFLTEMYIPVTDQWVFVAPMKTRMFSMCLVVCCGKVYVGDTQRRKDDTFSLEVYDPVANQWVSKEVMAPEIDESLLLVGTNIAVKGRGY